MPNRHALGGLLALGALAAVGWTVSMGPLAPTPVPTGAGQIAAVTGQVTSAPGQALYQASCAACHGPQGQGTPDGPDITNAGAALTDFMLRTGRMPLSSPTDPVQRGRPIYNDAEITALVDYVASFGNGPAIPNIQVSSASDIAAGRAAYTATCAACHGAGGSGDAVGGGAVAPPLLNTPPTQVAEAVRTGPGAMPAFDEHQITNDQLEGIAAYLAFLRDHASPGGQPVGGTGPVAEGYVAWIAYGVGLLLVARWVGRRGHR
jgi:ubiquinol-cytochrome c reductase cytochrome c subunit